MSFIYFIFLRKSFNYQISFLSGFTTFSKRNNNPFTCIKFHQCLLHYIFSTSQIQTKTFKKLKSYICVSLLIIFSSIQVTALKKNILMLQLIQKKYDMMSIMYVQKNGYYNTNF